MTTTTTREPGYETYWNAIDADKAWQAELDRLKIDRWSPQSHGAEGSDLRRLFAAKVAADQARYDATFSN